MPRLVKTPEPCPGGDCSGYIHHPFSTDTTCIKEVKRAEKDVEAGKIYFAEPFDSGVEHEDELRWLCRKHGLHIHVPLERDIRVEGQTKYCYEVYMDSVVEYRFGKDFKKNLIKQAANMDVDPNDTVSFCDCDDKSFDEGSNIKIDTNIYIKISKELKLSFKDKYERENLERLVTFYVDTSGNASGYFTGYDDFFSNENKKQENQLSDMAIEKMRKIRKWYIGKVKGRKHITEHYVDVRFK